MNAVQEQVNELVGVELAAANEKFLPFHSAHEGWAVIMEEAHELREATIALRNKLDIAFHDIMRNDAAMVDATIQSMEEDAVNAACEAIQVAAMCRKFMEMGKQNG